MHETSTELRELSLDTAKSRIEFPHLDHQHRRRSRERPVMFGGSNRALLVSSLVGLMVLAGGCSTFNRLSAIGEKPALSAIDDPIPQPGYKPVQMPMPPPQPASYNPNSLWRTGSRGFFKDQRAAQVGDILMVAVRITDRANFANETKRSRGDRENTGIGNFVGANLVKDQGPLPGRVLTADSTASSGGKGTAVRQEVVQTNVAAVVTQLLPNGTLVVEGKQEVRVNNEIRELLVAGMVRPEDIQSDNTIDSSKIAQARISYGGRGQISDVQQPRYGQQVLDVLLPF